MEAIDLRIERRISLSLLSFFFPPPTLLFVFRSIYLPLLLEFSVLEAAESAPDGSDTPSLYVRRFSKL